MNRQKYRLHHDGLDGSLVDAGSSSPYASNYLLLRSNYGSSAAGGASGSTGGRPSSSGTGSAGTPVPMASASPSSPVAGPSSASSAAGPAVLMLDDVSPVGRSGSSSSAHHLVQHQHYQSSDVDIKRDLSDMCVQQSSGHDDEQAVDDEQQQHKEAQYLSANCVLFMSYSGDASSVVDQHFSRALNAAESAYSAPVKSPGKSKTSARCTLN